MEGDCEAFVQIDYRDNAGGIKVEPVEKVFDYFVTTKGSQGIGLSIVKHIVEKLQGQISVSNENGGVFFSFKFSTKLLK
ncbi:histidine kinase [Thiovulum sp. ES]|nr:histidine kinase [Thiovulum sp. ES]